LNLREKIKKVHAEFHGFSAEFRGRGFWLQKNLRDSAYLSAKICEKKHKKVHTDLREIKKRFTQSFADFTQSFADFGFKKICETLRIYLRKSARNFFALSARNYCVNLPEIFLRYLREIFLRYLPEIIA
jgi:hypothetical protein